MLKCMKKEKFLINFDYKATKYQVSVTQQV